jgi:hypothetical protein
MTLFDEQHQAAHNFITVCSRINFQVVCLILPIHTTFESVTNKINARQTSTRQITFCGQYELTYKTEFLIVKL